MDLVVYQMMQLQVMHVPDSNRTVEKLSRTAIAQAHFTVACQRNSLPQLSVLSVI